MHAAVLQGKARTNNASEGWHNRFQTLVGKSHPSFYSFLKELQKEQASVEYVLRELSLGKKVKQVPSGRIQAAQTNIIAQVLSYEEYLEDGLELEFIKNMGHNLHL